MRRVLSFVLALTMVVSGALSTGSVSMASDAGQEVSSVSEQSGERDTSRMIPTEGMEITVTGTSEGNANNVFNNNDQTFWRSEEHAKGKWENTYLQVDLGEIYNLSQIDYMPRWGSDNYKWYKTTGNISKMVITYSVDGLTWSDGVEFTTPLTDVAETSDVDEGSRDYKLRPMVFRDSRGNEISIEARYVRFYGKESTHWNYEENNPNFTFPDHNKSMSIAYLAFYETEVNLAHKLTYPKYSNWLTFAGYDANEGVYKSELSTFGSETGKEQNIINDAFNANSQYGVFGHVDGIGKSSYVQVNLGKLNVIKEIELYPYWGNGRTYPNIVVALDDNEDFESPTIIYNTDKAGVHYAGIFGETNSYSIEAYKTDATERTDDETAAGIHVNVNNTGEDVEAQYVRLYMSGCPDMQNLINHIVELRVLGYERDNGRVNLQSLHDMNVNRLNKYTTDSWSMFATDSWSVFETAMEDAESVLADDLATKAAIEAATVDLEAAIAGLTLAEVKIETDSIANADVCGHQYANKKDNPNASIEGGAWNAVDLNSDAIWHTPWTGNPAKPCDHSNSGSKHWFMMELDSDYSIYALKYLPRSADSGVITGFQIQTSSDGTTWTSVAVEGGNTWIKDANLKTAELVTPARTKYIRLLVDSHSDTWVCAKQIYLLGVETESTALGKALREAKNLNEAWYSKETWEALESVVAEANTIYNASIAGEQPEGIYSVTERLNSAIAALEFFVYSSQEPFVFPTELNDRVTLEMEHLKQNNNTEGDDGYPLQVTEASWASDGMFLNGLNSNDEAILYYDAPTPGIYTAEVKYRSGSDANEVVWSEANGKVTAGSVLAGAGDNAGADHTAEFTFEVTQAGPGVLTFMGGAADAPQLDKIDIQLVTAAPEFSSASLTLYDNIAINFKVDATEFPVDTYTNLCAEFVVNGGEPIPVEYEEVNGKYVFEFTDVAPQCLNDVITATLSAEVGGKTVSSVIEYSGAQYCYNMLRRETSSAKLKTLCVDLLNYASEAQNFRGHNIEKLANATLTDAEKALATSETPNVEMIEGLNDVIASSENQSADVVWSGVGLRLDDSVSVRYEVKAKNGLENGLEEYKLRVVVDSKDSSRVWTIDLNDLVAGEDGVYYIYLDKLNAAQMRTKLYATVVDSNNQPVSVTLPYSVETYVAAMGDSEVGNLVNAMMKYGDAAAAFVNPATGN